ncbi:MAG TPA: translocation/assembly module TamB domain-containing protein [Gemmatimonadaceae bacterium]|jgi:translocation and assembly module TamB
MKRRSLVALVSAAVLLMLGIVAVSTVLFITRTESGRARVRQLLQPLLTDAARGGSFYLGHLGGNFITNVTVDSIAIRDKRGELLASTGPVSLTFNPRDLIDLRIFITRATIEHPYVHLIEHDNGAWNFQEIFSSGNNAPKKPKDVNTRNLGDYIVIDSASTRNGAFLLSLPWRPDEKGAARDSVIRVHLNNPEKAVSRTFDGYARTYRWSNIQAFIDHVRLTDPDSDRKFGQDFKVRTLSADEFEPTFKFRNVRGEARHLGDSVWFDAPHFDMPASTGHGKGRIWWGSNLPMRYDIAIHGDSVSLDDVNWVYPTLPRTGGGALDLLIKNDPDPKKMQIVDFQLVNMDVHSTKSHVTGDMTFGTGAPLLLVQNVNLRADPVDFDLLRTLAGKPFPEDWQGKLTGTVKARGGPLTNFYVDDARGEFDDAHVRGAVSRFSGHGELDILDPAFTEFHHFYANVPALDLRTIEYLFPAFPRLGGFVSGTATLDSSWLDVRFSDARLAHQDGPGDPSVVTGSGRVTDAGQFMVYDLELDAQPLSWTMLARSYPFLPLRGLMSGPIRVKGSSPDLEVSTSLQGVAGALSYDGRVDADSIGGYGAHGRGQFSALSVGQLLEKSNVPAGLLSGHYDVDLTGADAATLAGAADVAIERTIIDSLRVYPSEAYVRFADGRMLVDSLTARTAAFTVAANGGIGLPKGQPDSLHFAVTIDSLGGFRSYISHPDTTLLGRAGTPPDSLSGAITLNGVMAGTFDSLDLRARAAASNLYKNAESAGEVNGTFNVHDLLGTRSGDAQIHVDSAVIAGVALDTVGGTFRFADGQHALFNVSALSRNGPTASAAGSWTSALGAQTVVLDSLGFKIDDDDWRLAQTVHLARDSVGVRLDSLVLRNRDTAVVVLAADFPDTGSVSARVRASRVALSEFSSLAQFRDSITGVADLDASISGTRVAPRIAANAALTSIRVRGIPIDSVSAVAQYADARLAVNGDVVRGGQRAVTANANLPVEITLPFGVRRLTDSLSGELHADSTDLSIVSTLLKGTVDSVTGRLTADVRLAGKWNAPVVDGNVSVRNGSAIVQPIGVKIVAINGTISGAVTPNSTQDSISVDLHAANDKQPTGTIGVTGWIKLPGQSKASPALDLKLAANQFHALNKRSLADLYLSTIDPLELHGTVQAPVLDGSLRVDRGSIYLADRDLARKLAVEEVADSTTSGGGSGIAVLSTLLANLSIPNVTITLGDNVRLRSSEANVRLAGQLQLITDPSLGTHVLASGVLVPRLSLQGQLRTVDGTYLFNLAGVVQREFSVLANGTVDFDGPPETPTLDIKAQYNVKQPRDRDIGVIANLTGRVPDYNLTLSGNADYDISQSDLVSYLLTGRPGLDLGGANNSGASQVLASVLAPTLSAVAAAGLRQNLGNWVDMLQFQLGTADNTQGQSAFDTGNLRNYLASATISAEQQFGSRLFFNINTGLCAFAQTTNASFAPLGSVGAQAEYRFDPRLSMQLAYEPPTANRICSREAQFLSGFQPTPGQFSFSFSHTWHF